MNKKIIIAIVVIFLAGAAVWYFLGQKKDETYSGPIEKIRIGNVGEYTIFNLIAEDKGYFKEYGLEASIKEFTSGPASIAGLLAGEVDVTIAADFVAVRNIFSNPGIRILSVANQHRVFQLAARKDLGIVNPVDLKGKKIGVTKNSAGEYFIGDFLAKNGLALSDVVTVDLTPADMLIQLEAGTIDAISVFEPHIYKLKQKTSHELTIWEIQGDQNINALVYSTKAFIDANPYQIERYLRSLVTAEKYYKAHREEVKEFIAQKLKYEKAYVDYSWPRFSHEIGLAQELVLNMEAEARWAITNKLTTATKVPNYIEYIYFDALKKVKPEAVTIIH